MKTRSMNKWYFDNGLVRLIRGNLGILIGFALMCIFLSLYTDSFATSRNIFNVMRQISTNIFLACGVSLVILIGGIDLSVGSIIAVSGCLCAGLITNTGMASGAAILVSILVGTLLGVVNGLIVANTKIPSFIVTLAMMNVGRGFVRIYTNATTILVDDPLFIWIGSGKLFGNIPVQLVFMAVVIAITAIVLNRTKFGRNIYAVGDNKLAAIYGGINAKKVTLIVFVISGFFAACAGILSAARTFSGQFSVGDGAEMDAISAIVLGGTSMSGGIGT
ncbi:MAG: ABC transporter permease, partial [Lachnoclostridium sp.]|nr:ABC transporter permease [Lachnoclostridium sp.]